MSSVLCSFASTFWLSSDLAAASQGEKVVLSVRLTSLGFPSLWVLDHSRPHCLGISLTSSQKVKKIFLRTMALVSDFLSFSPGVSLNSYVTLD